MLGPVIGTTTIGDNPNPNPTPTKSTRSSSIAKAMQMPLFQFYKLANEEIDDRFADSSNSKGAPKVEDNPITYSHKQVDDNFNTSIPFLPHLNPMTASVEQATHQSKSSPNKQRDSPKPIIMPRVPSSNSAKTVSSFSPPRNYYDQSIYQPSNEHHHQQHLVSTPRKRTWSNAPSLANSDCSDSHLSSRQVTPTSIISDGPTSSSGEFGSTYSYEYGTATTSPDPNNSDYYFTPVVPANTMLSIRLQQQQQQHQSHQMGTDYSTHTYMPRPLHWFQQQGHYGAPQSSSAFHHTNMTTVPTQMQNNQPPLYCSPVGIEDRYSSSYRCPSPNRSRSISEDRSDSSSPPCSPAPQTFKNDLHRKSKVKTELCVHFMKGSICPFGSKCNYAHGEKELKYGTLFELKNVGMVEDVNTYRTHPCFTWVSTGACPFGLRCSCLHDPAVDSSTSSWLPHSDVPVTNLATELNVDKSSHRILASFHQPNPLVHKKLWDLRHSFKLPSDLIHSKHMNNGSKDWMMTYALVSNMVNFIPDRPLEMLSDLQRLSIAFLMNYHKTSPHQEYIFKPTHMIFNELCMVLQERYFKLLSSDSYRKSFEVDGLTKVDALCCSVKELSYDEYRTAKNQSSCDDVIVVRDLAFGCVGEASAKPSLWFGISGNDMKPRSNQDVKRFKRERQRAVKPSNVLPDSPYPGSKESNQSLFMNHTEKPFLHMQLCSDEHASLDLIKSILEHRLVVLTIQQMSGQENIPLPKDSRLLNQFRNMKKDIEKWKWSVNKGREVTDEHTPVPLCSSKYRPSDSAKISSKIWQSFVGSLQDDASQEGEDASDSDLGVLRTLSDGKSIRRANNSTAPHLKTISEPCSEKNGVWKSLFCKPCDQNDWEMIQEHFHNRVSGMNKDKNMPLSTTTVEKNNTGNFV